MAKSWPLAMKMGMCLFLKKYTNSKNFVITHTFDEKLTNAIYNVSWGSLVEYDILICP